ncbi:hypothetical protein HYW82_03355 [Candidatus Peregrinibacteria bacterium]|nr:hypothetical protein [Candidatus Peregrinibacteria bacterium]
MNDVNLLKTGDDSGLQLPETGCDFDAMQSLLKGSFSYQERFINTGITRYGLLFFNFLRIVFDRADDERLKLFIVERVARDLIYRQGDIQDEIAAWVVDKAGKMNCEEVNFILRDVREKFLRVADLLEK